MIVHWTAGGPHPSDADLDHYHLLVSRSGELILGNHSISDNVSTSDDDYAAHTRLCNTAAIGVALCGMLGAVEKPFQPGPYPLTKSQWNMALFLVADLCRFYGIKPERKTLLMHCEVEPVLGVKQKGKWDISVLPFPRGIWSDLSPGEELRQRVAILLNR